MDKTYLGRSIPLETFGILLKKNNIKFLSLQKGFGSEQLKDCLFRKNFVECQNKIDGIDASHLILGTGTTPRKEFLHYTSRGELEGIRSGDWKLLRKKPRNKKQGETIMLFNLSKDVGEENNLASEQPAIVARLSSRMKELDQEIEKNARQPWLKN